MKKITYDTYKDMVVDLLDIFEGNEDVTIVCDYELANIFSKQIDLDRFDDVDIDFSDPNNEYYVSRISDEVMYIEPASGNTAYKWHETNSVYYVDVDFEEISKKIDADRHVIMNYDKYTVICPLDLDECNNKCEYCCYDEDENVCDCEECTCEECIGLDRDSLSDENLEIIKLLVDYTDKVLATEGCQDCVFEMLTELYFIGRQHGADDVKDSVKEFLG